MLWALHGHKLKPPPGLPPPNDPKDVRNNSSARLQPEEQHNDATPC
jgi:hypothetical protein